MMQRAPPAEAVRPADALSPGADWASRQLVARMWARAAARPGLPHALADDFGRTSMEVAQEPAAKVTAPAMRTAAGGGGASGASIELPASLSTRAEDAEVCRRLLYACVFAASVNVHCVAQLLLSQSYRRACRRRLDEDDIILPLAHAFCRPVDWARCAATCRAVRRLGWSSSRPRPSRAVTSWLRGYTAEARNQVLKACIQHNVLGMLRPLADAGADMNCVFEQYWFRTPLHRAASRGNAELCRQLLALRADAAIRDSHGAAPIHLVASKGRQAIVELLLQHDPASAGAVDFSDRTPYHMAALKGHLNVVKCLIAARADASHPSLDGRTPLEMARRGQHAHVVDFLERHARREEEDIPAARLLLGELFRRSAPAPAERPADPPGDAASGRRTGGAAPDAAAGPPQ